MKTALVIGGNSGIGSEAARCLAENGIKVCATYHKDKKNIQDLISTYQTDLLNEGSVKSTLQKILKEHKQVDIVVFSVSQPIKNKSLLNLEWKDFEEHLDLQIKGLFCVVQNLKEQIQAKHKTKFIIILTEYCIGKPPAGISHYVAAKYCLMGLAKSMAAELSKYNCTVNMISPGMVETSLISNLPPKLVELTAENNPLKRIATPKDVANVILFLSGDDSDYLNGANITVNGGSVMQ